MSLDHWWIWPLIILVVVAGVGLLQDLLRKL
jgi:hypothetical protein